MYVVSQIFDGHKIYITDFQNQDEAESYADELIADGHQVMIDKE